MYLKLLRFARSARHWVTRRVTEQAQRSVWAIETVPVPVERRRGIETPEHYRSQERTMGAVQRTGGLTPTIHSSVRY